MRTRFTAQLAATTLTVVALAAVVTALALAGGIAPNPPTCEGKAVTILGTAAADFIVGTAGPDVILGGDGNDVIRGLEGNDIICGGQGDDDIYGGAGNDIAYGEAGNDFLDAVVNDDGSVDNVLGGSGEDRVATKDGVAGDFGSAGPGVDTCSLDAGDPVASC